MIRRVMNGVGMNILDKIIVSGTQLAMVPVFATAWGLHLYGLWVMLSTIPTFLAMGDLGFATAAGTKMTMANARGERDEAVRIFQSAWVAILLSSGVMVLLAIAGSQFFPLSLLGNDVGMSEPAFRALLLLLLLYGIAVLQGSIFFAGFRCAGLFAAGAFWNAIIILIESTAAIVLVLLGGSPIVAAAALLGGRLIGLAGQNILLRRMVPWLKIGMSEARLIEIRSILGPAGAVMVLPLAQALALQGAALAVGAAAGRAAVPSFTAARTLSRIGLQMCWLLNSALMPEASAAIARSDRRALAMMVLATLAVSALLVVPFASLFAAFGQQAVLIWSHGVIKAPQPLMVFMAGSVLFGGFWFPMSNLILAANRHASYTLIFLIFAAFSAPISYVLALHFGATGGGIALCALDFAMFIVIVVLTQRILVTVGELRAAVPAAWDYLSGLKARVRAS